MTIRRRTLLKSAVAASALLPLSQMPSPAKAQATGQKILIKGGYVATVDPQLGEIKNGDILIDEGKIAAIGTNLASDGAMVIDASGKLVMPGLIDTHRHTWETQLRGLIPEGDFFMYLTVILQQIAPRYRPEDVRIGNLMGCLGALDSGITTMLDWSHIMNTPAHADAAIQGLKESGMRTVFAHGGPSGPWSDWWTPKSTNRHPDDARRIRKQYFASQEGLVSMALALNGPDFSTPETAIDDIKMARDLAVPMTIHCGTPGNVPGSILKLGDAKMLGPDITFVHTLHNSDEELKAMADNGCTISTSPATEILSGHGFPSVQHWKKFGLKPSISIDNETRMPTDLWTQMRGLMMSDRMTEIARARRQGGKPNIVSVREMLEFATLQGAKTLGLEKKTGSLTVGKQADVIVINLQDINLLPSNDPIASAVLMAGSRNVSWIIVNGKVKKQNGELVGYDLTNLNKALIESHEFLTKNVDAVK